MKIKFKKILVTFLIGFILFSIVEVIAFVVLTQSVESEFKRESVARTEIVAELVKNALVLFDYHEVQKITQTLMKNKEVEQAIIENKHGEIIAKNTKDNKDIGNTSFDISLNIYTDDPSLNKVYLGKITLTFSYSVLRGIFKKHLIVISISIALLLVIVLFAFVFITRSLVTFFKQLKLQFLNLENGEEALVEKPSRVDEFYSVTNNLCDLSKKLVVLKNKEKENIKLKTISKISTQVAHDIRSPLSALSVATADLKILPEEQRILIRSAVQRIEDIANDLSNRERENSAKEQAVLSKQLLSSLIERLISEKRTQYRNKPGIKIEGQLGKESYGIFAKIQPSEFKRVLSNIINNSIEAFDAAGTVSISLRSNEQIVNIIINDNGKGIPEEHLPKLMSKGATFGKVKGQGLGLFHARETIESWNGSIDIESEFGKGTEINIFLPREKEPDWFLPELSFLHNYYIVILDDDDSIHQIWQNRFNELKIDHSKILHFKESEKVIEYYNDKKLLLSKSPKLFLFDYELIGSLKNGLEVIEALNIREGAVLVTSHFEEDHVRNECARLNVKLLPKNLAGFVPIKIEKEHSTKLPIKKIVLIDDDDLIRKTWLIMAKRSGIDLYCFSTPDEFENRRSDFNSNTNIYIDSNLSNGVKGEIVAKELYQKGFTEIYLATGSSPQEFSDMPWIKDIVGKDPPFDF
jgi:signal transduction histidine kinase